MATTSTYSFLPSSPILPSLFSPKIKSMSRASNAKTLAMKREAHDRNYYNGRLADESMIVLRMRIHEMGMIERNYEPPVEWMDWEKNLYSNYDSNICEPMGFLQSELIDTRPSLALGIIVLIASSVPTSTALVLFHLVGLAKEVLAGLHIS